MIIFQKERDGSIRGASENENSISLFPWKLWNMKAASPLQNLAINCIFTAALRMRAGLSGRRRRRWHKKGKEKRKFLLVAGTLSAGDDAIIFLAFCPHALNLKKKKRPYFSLFFLGIHSVGTWKACTSCCCQVDSILLVDGVAEFLSISIAFLSSCSNSYWERDVEAFNTCGCAHPSFQFFPFLLYIFCFSVVWFVCI